MKDFKFINNTTFKLENTENINYTIVYNNILEETNLSSLAKMLYINTLKFQNSKTHRVSINSLYKTVKEGRTAVSNALNELISFGYMKRVERKNEYGLNNGYDYKCMV